MLQAEGYTQSIILSPKRGGPQAHSRLTAVEHILEVLPFRMLHTADVLCSALKGEWFTLADLKGAYLHVPITPKHRMWGNGLRLDPTRHIYTPVRISQGCKLALQQGQSMDFLLSGQGRWLSAIAGKHINALKLRAVGLALERFFQCCEDATSCPAPTTVPQGSR